MKTQQNNYFSWNEYTCIIVGGTWPIEEYKPNKDRSEYARSYYFRRKAKQGYEQGKKKVA